jgi:3',5'-cyclic AMP phosphodiesterase CpdA
MHFAQISDIHVPDFEGVRVRDFMNKRATGLLNLLTGRRGAHPIELAERLIEDLSNQKLDHVMVTGDLTNLSLPGEFQRAAKLLRLLGGFDELTVIPGNHDVYTKGAELAGRFQGYFADLLWPDTTPVEERVFPVVKDLGPISVFALSSAIATAPLIAWGEVSEAQLRTLERELTAPSRQGQFKVVLVHHNLHHVSSPWKQYSSRLRNAEALIEVCTRHGVDLVLHGHTHGAHRFTAERSGKSVTVIGCGSSTQMSPDPRKVARYNIYSVSQKQLKVRTRVYDLVERRFGWLV